MVARKSGNIINLASVVGIRDRMVYCTTKFAVVGQTKRTVWAMRRMASVPILSIPRERIATLLAPSYSPSVVYW